MKILFINAAKGKYGGSIYEKMAREALSDDFQVKVKNLSSGKGKFLWQLYRLSGQEEADLAIRNLDTSLSASRKPVKNIAIIHHIDYSFSPKVLRIISPLLIRIIFHNLKKFDAIVTVSKYWQDYFKKKGYKNVELIYNAFDLNEFSFSEEEVSLFKEKNGLDEKPIIYLGNCQEAKGVVESYQQLKDLDATLVTSGESSVKIPARNLEVSHSDYLRLLKASSVVLAMSKFKEGWCRTAHEAMLFKTPVIGSGSGGMEELLERGGQMVCHDFSSLREKVEYLLVHPEIRKKMGESGFAFAKGFTLEKFKEDWLKLINKLT